MTYLTGIPTYVPEDSMDLAELVFLIVMVPAVLVFVPWFEDHIEPRFKRWAEKGDAEQKAKREAKKRG